ncbi:dTDP-4-amino-4,6-dideoxygalactose transaminase [Endothiovibrio diazotrophicus]
MIRRANEALLSGDIGGDGAFSQRAEAILERETGVGRALLTTSGTHALEMMAILLDLRPGDEVIVPSFTFVSTALAFVMHGATLVFCDVREDTLNLDERCLARLVSARTRAIVPVHYAGVSCEMGEIRRIAAECGALVLEDNAHGPFGGYHGERLGSMGSLAALSFHETKNLTTGEGGALLINDERFIERAEIIREKGTNRSQFVQGRVDKYTWVDKGSSYVMSDILAALLYAQLEDYRSIQARRADVWGRYFDSLTEWAAEQRVRLPVVPPGCEQSFHMFYLLMDDQAQRDRFIAEMKEEGIGAVFHYPPLHRSRPALEYGAAGADCPVSESISGRLVRLPFYTGMGEDEQRHVIDRVKRHRA